MWLGVLLEMYVWNSNGHFLVADKVILTADIPTFKMIPQNPSPPWGAAKSIFKPLLNFHIKD